METPPPTDTKAEVQPKDFVTATLPINPESTELLFAGQATINCGSGDQERGVTYVQCIKVQKVVRKMWHMLISARTFALSLLSEDLLYHR